MRRFTQSILSLFDIKLVRKHSYDATLAKLPDYKKYDLLKILKLNIYGVTDKTMLRKNFKKKYWDDLGRITFLKFNGVFVDIYWRLRRKFIPCSDNNRHELYMSVIKVTDN